MKVSYDISQRKQIASGVGPFNLSRLLRLCRKLFITVLIMAKKNHCFQLKLRDEIKEVHVLFHIAKIRLRFKETS